MYLTSAICNYNVQGTTKFLLCTLLSKFIVLCNNYNYHCGAHNYNYHCGVQQLELTLWCATIRSSMHIDIA